MLLIRFGHIDLAKYQVSRWLIYRQSCFQDLAAPQIHYRPRMCANFESISSNTDTLPMNASANRCNRETGSPEPS